MHTAESAASDSLLYVRAQGMTLQGMQLTRYIAALMLSTLLHKQSNLVPSCTAAMVMPCHYTGGTTLKACRRTIVTSG